MDVKHRNKTENSEKNPITGKKSAHLLLTVPKGIDDALAANAIIKILTDEDIDKFILETTAATLMNAPIAVENEYQDVKLRVRELLDHLEKCIIDKKDFKISEENLQDFAIIRSSNLGDWTMLKGRLQTLNIGTRDLNKHLKKHELSLSNREVNNNPSKIYQVGNGRLQYAKSSQNGALWTDLGNFDAKIVKEVTVDDGAEIKKVFVLEGFLDDGTPLPSIQIPSDQFASLQWTTEKWGSGPIIYAGSGVRDHLRAAIQTLSGKVSKHMVHGHTGWKIIDGKRYYLHGAGAIGETGDFKEAAVDLGDPKLAQYVLPEPVCGQTEIDAILASLRLLDLGPLKIIAPALAATYASVLNEFTPTDFSIWLAGPTGVFKSELSALLQNHFGSNFSGKNLPGNWSSTDNSLERQAYILKDCLFVIDDFAPSGSHQDVQRLHKSADRLLRAQGNRSGRGRLNADASGKPAYFPRGVICSTGEDLPRGQSIRARTVLIFITRGDLDQTVLTELQGRGRNGELAQAMSGFIKYVAARYGELAKTIPVRRNELRNAIVSTSSHTRTPDTVAILLVAFEMVLDYAASIGAIDYAKKAQLSERGSIAIKETASEQVALQNGEDQVNCFLNLIVAALASGSAHFADAQNGGMPSSFPAACGWRQYSGELGTLYWHPMGDKIGWIAGKELWLQSDAAFAAAQAMAKKQNENIAISKLTLWKGMAERGLIIKGEPQKHGSKRTVEGQPGRSVIRIPDKNLILGELESTPSTKTLGMEKNDENS